ncbi:MAG: flagellar basal body-associated FliL family protein [Pseudomonadota bacterium]
MADEGASPPIDIEDELAKLEAELDAITPDGASASEVALGEGDVQDRSHEMVELDKADFLFEPEKEPAKEDDTPFIAEPSFQPEIDTPPVAFKIKWYRKRRTIFACCAIVISIVMGIAMGICGYLFFGRAGEQTRIAVEKVFYGAVRGEIKGWIEPVVLPEKPIELRPFFVPIEPGQLINTKGTYLYVSIAMMPSSGYRTETMEKRKALLRERLYIFFSEQATSGDLNRILTEAAKNRMVDTINSILGTKAVEGVYFTKFYSV